MTGLGFREDQKISAVFKGRRKSDFAVSAEIIPPRNGAEQGLVLEQIEALVAAGAQFLSVTKGAGGSLRSGSLPIALAIKERFNKPCIAHFTCRDLTVQEVENQLMDHHYFGIRNVLALRGDPPTDQPHWQPRDGSLLYAYQLIEQIKRLNQGIFLERATKETLRSAEKTDFCIGAAVYPDDPNPTTRLEYFKRKVEAGAEYGVTQMLFDTESYARLLEACHQASIRVPIIPGTRLLKDQEQAQRMAKRFGVQLSATLLKALPLQASADNQQALEAFHQMVARLKALGAPGLHLFVLSDTALAAQFLRQL